MLTRDNSSYWESMIKPTKVVIVIIIITFMLYYDSYFVLIKLTDIIILLHEKCFCSNTSSYILCG